MINELDSRQLLQAYNFVMEQGEPTEYGKQYQGIEAFSDYDGYSIYLRGNGVQLKLGFHNTYHLDYDDEWQKERFLRVLKVMLQSINKCSAP